MPMRYIFYIMGKSATGKNMVYEGLLGDEALGLSPLVPWTTRPIRAGERDGADYHFTDEEGLAAMEREGRVIEKRVYHTVLGDWTYFTAALREEDGEGDLLGIGTLESFEKLRDYYGAETVIPLYVETPDDVRLERALKRERKQSEPNYEEMCRRFLADQKDFSDARLAAAGITVRFVNDADKEECVAGIAAYIGAVRRGERELYTGGDL